MGKRYEMEYKVQYGDRWHRYLDVGTSKRAAIEQCAHCNKHDGLGCRYRIVRVTTTETREIVK
jgi:hypothetical protein